MKRHGFRWTHLVLVAALAVWAPAFAAGTASTVVLKAASGRAEKGSGTGLTAKAVLKELRTLRWDARDHSREWQEEQEHGIAQPDRHLCSAVTGKGAKKTTVIMIHGANQEPNYPLFKGLIDAFGEEGIDLKILAPNRVQLAQVFAQQKKPVVLIVHSAGGAYGLKLGQLFGKKRVSAIIGISPVPPGLHRKLEVPTLIFHGTDDYVVPIEASRMIKARYPDVVTLKPIKADHSARRRDFAILDDLFGEKISGQLKAQAETTPETKQIRRQIAHEAAQFIREHAALE